MKNLTDITKELLESKSEYKIFCDMDGVLVNFKDGYEELTGITTKEADSKGPAYFWKPVDTAGENFWAQLDWMSDGKQLWSFIKKYSPELLSSPSRSKSSAIGKHKWVNKHISGVKLNLSPRGQKQNFAKPNHILIDDMKKTIDEWNAKGGIGILHTSATNTIKQLKQYLNK